jgi:hypothetical protein
MPSSKHPTHHRLYVAAWLGEIEQAVATHVVEVAHLEADVGLFIVGRLNKLRPLDASNFACILLN